MPRGVAAEVVLEGVEEEAAKKVEEACREVGVNSEDAVKEGLEAGDAAEVVPKMSMKMASNSRPINLGEAITEEGRGGMQRGRGEFRGRGQGRFRGGGRGRGGAENVDEDGF